MNALTKFLTMISALGFLLFSVNSYAADPTRVDLISNKDFAATVSAAETAIKSQGFMIVAKIDHQNMLTMVGAKIKGATTIEFGKPAMGKMLLPMAPEAGLEFPGRLYIWQRADGKTVVSYRKPSSDLGRYGNAMLTKMGKDMDGMWAMFAAAATK